MKTTKLTLKNEFHGTEAAVVPQKIESGRFKGLHRISRRTASRLRRELCGSQSCSCGGHFGERPGTQLDVVGLDANDYIVDIRD